MKSAISVLVAKFACFNLAAKFPAVNFLNSCVLIIYYDHDQVLSFQF